MPETEEQWRERMHAEEAERLKRPPTGRTVEGFVGLLPDATQGMSTDKWISMLRDDPETEE